jgi:hypothetical protein
MHGVCRGGQLRGSPLHAHVGPRVRRLLDRVPRGILSDIGMQQNRGPRLHSRMRMNSQPCDDAKIDLLLSISTSLGQDGLHCIVWRGVSFWGTVLTTMHTHAARVAAVLDVRPGDIRSGPVLQRGGPAMHQLYAVRAGGFV